MCLPGRLLQCLPSISLTESLTILVHLVKGRPSTDMLLRVYSLAIVIQETHSCGIFPCVSPLKTLWMSQCLSSFLLTGRLIFVVHLANDQPSVCIIPRIKHLVVVTERLTLTASCHVCISGRLGGSRNSCHPVIGSPSLSIWSIIGPHMYIVQGIRSCYCVSRD